MSHRQQVLTAAQMQAAEQALIDGGETVESLMERAGAGAAEWVWRVSAGRPVTVLCGPGNNGGDGYVIARVLAERGVDVSVVAPMEPKTDAAIAACQAWGGEPVQRAHGEVFVDCLFGTGLSRPLSDELRDLLANLAANHRHSIAIDLPSGVDSDTGGTFDTELPNYDLTLALGASKCAHWLMPASVMMGERRLVDIGIGQVEGAVELAGRPVIAAPAADTHKYSRGTLLVVGGEMTGAGLLAARAAQHSGAGYVKLWSEHSHPALPADLVHLDGRLDEALTDDRLDAVLVGPGLGRDDKARERLSKILDRGLPTVLDADALWLLTPRMLEGHDEQILATPHEGELARLCESFGVEADSKIDRATALSKASGMTVLAKGPDNVLAARGGVVVFKPAPVWLSTAGTGDVLAGIAASRMATGSGASQSALEAVPLHSEAARLAGAYFSASQIIDHIPAAFARFT